MSMMIHRAVLRQKKPAEKPVEENKHPEVEQKDPKPSAPKRKRKPKR